MLALRSVLLIDALDERALRAATTTAADAVLIDLAGASAIAQRERARTALPRLARPIARAGRPVLVRLPAPRAGLLDADADALVGEWLAGVVIAGTEEPQDGRDVDVQVRKHEMRRTRTPGAIALIAEVDSAAGVLALPRILPAIDRFGAILLDLDRLLAEVGRGAVDHALATISTLAEANGVDWLLRSTGARADIAHSFGASGVVIESDAEALGANSLFTPQPSEVEHARAVLAAWSRRRGAGVIAVGGEAVDRRAARRAQRLVDRADAIARREG